MSEDLAFIVDFFFACFASYSFYVYKTVIIPYKNDFSLLYYYIKKNHKILYNVKKNAAQNIVEGHT